MRDSLIVRLVDGLLPYCVSERRIRERDGTVEYFKWVGNNEIRTKPEYWLPHCIMRHWTAARKRRRVRRHKEEMQRRLETLTSSCFDRDIDAEVSRVARARDDAGVKAPSARILVCLHLFYPDLWPLVKAYLANLTPYRWNLVLTYPEGLIPSAALEEVRKFKPDVTFLACRNAGFDIGPFVESLNHVDLSDYDIVFKLQTKGCRREKIFIYDQVFKRSDWLFNLYEGVLGGQTVHETVRALAAGECDLAAAANLLVRDPLHKQHFVKRLCEERNIPYVEDYRFVAGTCFAVRSAALAPLKALKLTLADFDDTVRGRFSLAHALERWMCFAAADRMRGVPVEHPTYDEETARERSLSALRLLKDPRFEFDDDYVYRSMEFARFSDYEVAEVRLGDIRRVWFDLRSYRLDECSPYKYLNGDVEAYERYCSENSRRSRFQMSRERFDALCASMTEFDGRHLPLVFGPNNIILDGQHRCCILLKRFGPDHRIPVIRVLPAFDNDD